MKHYNQDFDNLGRNIQEIVDRAVNSRDFERLNQTIRQTVGKAVDIGSEAVRKAADHSARKVRTVRQEPVRTVENRPVLYASTSGRHTAGVLKIVGGGILSLFSLALMMSLMVLEWLLFDIGFFPLAWGGIASGGLLIFSGIRTLGRVKRFKTYCRTLGQKTHCTLEALARSVGKSVKFVHKEVRRMINEGLFLQGHLDKEQTRLITSDETYHQFEQSRLQLEARQRQLAAEQQAAAARDPRLQEVLDRGNAFVAQIRKCNDDIPGEEVSAKMDRMEQIVRRIFRRAEACPEIVPDLKKLMDYYLPMTVKLLNAYADMDAQPIQGENIISAKREIEATLDTLNAAFEKLLDDLFMDTAMDVSSDISVLNTMLAQEGLTEDELTKMRRERNL